ncbi:DNA-binding SARP family transcriptional activator/tetratricopeptide (TPR) repeat protein [Kitasatospora gansuensis]|uniref:DNA-binding SARP family transcriptional activator/tetratricopeptide (TPR) repeat protein n=1 Tax=Kitasatospora gansuensis TaxID=258050 RepID=A0A7W7SIZ1_9ACTN|nr:BTAD domain-containing putative transcriptional regulator [Kitasatospora gansuensis]MBB4951355.1 DNA-binding SARP family transcriptional activator/tetratricopeptide (TPR) repeat protein [Kitasatospora gansuensis]
MHVLVRLLGRVGVETADGFVPAGTAKQSAVLAVLAMTPGRRVGVDHLIDRVWEEHPPPTARSTLYAYLARLRRVLVPWPELQLLRDGAGYTLTAEPEQIDVHRLRRLAADAERAERDGDRPRSAELLGAAARLWDSPLAGVPGAWADRMRETLTREYLEIQTSRYRTELGLGRPGPVAAELSPLVAEHPLAEPLVTLLLLALRQSGRTAEALELYERTRTRLREELGSDPGAALADAHRQLLAGDRTAPAPPPVVIPRQLPPVVRELTGRRAELAELDGLLPDGLPALVLVSGMAGVGKTALTTWWAQQVRSHFPDGQLHLNLRGHGPGEPMTPGQALTQLLGALGVQPEQIPADEQQAAALYRSVLAERRVLLLLDNARTAQQVRPLLPAGPLSCVLVTSRERLTGLIARDGARDLRLGLLTPDQAVTLIARLVGSDRVAQEPEAAAEIARTCGLLPLAIRIATAGLAGADYPTLADRAAALSGTSALAELEVLGDEQAAIRTAFDYSYQALTPDQQLLFRRLGLLPVPEFGPRGAAALTGSTPERTAPLLRRLLDAHLITQVAADRYTVHDLLRRYAQLLGLECDPEADRLAASRRLYALYLHLADSAARTLFPQFVRLPIPEELRLPGEPFTDARDAAAWIAQYEAALVLAQSAAVAQGAPEMAWLLSDALRPHYTARRGNPHWLPVARTALAAALARDDRAAVMASLTSLAMAHHCTGDYRRAVGYNRWIVRVAERITDGPAELHRFRASALERIGVACSILGRADQAVEYMSAALAVYQQLGRRTGIAINHNNLGADYLMSGRLTEAEAHLTEALEIHRSAGARRGEAAALINLGVLRHRRGDLDAAVLDLTTAHLIDRDLGHLDGEAAALVERSAVALSAGRPEDALHDARTALALVLRTGDPFAECGALLALGGYRLAMGHTRPAALHLRRALRLAVTSGVRHPELRATLGLAEVELLEHRPAEAARLAGQVVDLCRTGGYRPLEARALLVIATAHLHQGTPAAAVPLAEQAAAIQRAIDHRSDLARTEALLARARRA